MKVLLDTSVLVPAFVRGLPRHRMGLTCYRDALSAENELLVGEFLKANGGFELEQERSYLPSGGVGEGGAGWYDGGYAALLRRVSGG